MIEKKIKSPKNTLTLLLVTGRGRGGRGGNFGGRGGGGQNRGGGRGGGGGGRGKM